MKEIINISQVSLGYKDKELLKVNFKIYKGDFCIISGNNATGKSLLLKLLYMKILPKKGNIFLFGKKIDEKSKNQILDYRKNIGVILHDDTLIPFFTVYQNIELSSEIQNSKKDFLKRINEILNWLDLTKIKNSYINQLSSGERQKVSIARALINNPSIIIADQPESYLDQETSKKLFFLFNSINKLGTTIILSTNKPLNNSENCRIIELK
ncbi:MAG: Cell division ATP-binding protein FtsE [Alphaproteobacteria bacterium MarineAlpha8_Bin1]|nr:MAG: Cell division ATP-binding protein FtsE [Alphaproteobacteria bacterium MarineAlpha8_Bin1]|tara:strand:- start:2063 stop:2695 length:633 start_codon:yes stop_codon:yes gene_type:complete